MRGETVIGRISSEGKDNNGKNRQIKNSQRKDEGDDDRKSKLEDDGDWKNSSLEKKMRIMSVRRRARFEEHQVNERTMMGGTKILR